MSTRCNIKIIEKDQTIWLYHHHDGYPRYVGAFLLAKYYDKFKDTNNYLDACVIANELIKDKNDDEFEVTDGMHGDIEYLYELDINKREIRCFEIGYAKHNDNWEQVVGDQIDLIAEACAWKVTKSDKDNTDIWYLSREDLIYSDEDGNTIYFNSLQEAQRKALELMFDDIKDNADGDD